MFRFMVMAGCVGIIIVWVALLAATFIPHADEVSPHLDAATEGGEPPIPALRASHDFVESTLVVRSPYQFIGDADNGDWIFTEEWDDGTTHQVRIHFTTVSAQGTVTGWVDDALLVKSREWLEGRA